MDILLKTDIVNYRYTVGKAAFLTAYPNYELMKDIFQSNCMELIDDDNKKIIVSIFRQPTCRTDTNEKVRVYYLRGHINQDKHKNENESVFELSADFESIYNKFIENAFKNTSSFLSSLAPNISSMIQKYFEHAENKINQYNIFYKYYPQGTIKENRHDIVNGTLSFSHPRFFNDPFDCNCVLYNNKDMSNLFRVLCITNESNNILMWSYYSENHKGYCVEYSYSKLIEVIKELDISGICIFGEVIYTKKRPPQKSPVKKFSFTDIEFYINVTFNKFEEWKHEKELRFVIISDFYNDPDRITTRTDINSIYEGCNGDKTEIVNSDGLKLNVIPLFKDHKEYLLVRDIKLP